MPSNRRTVLGGFASAAVLAADGKHGAASARMRGYAAPAIEDRLDDSAEALKGAADDFGHIVRKRPAAVFRPASTTDIADLLRWAGDRKLKVAARGQGHSIYGRSMAEGGIVIAMGAMNAIHRIGADRIVVDAGATWQTVLEATLPRGLTPPVLTNYLDLSVGGTLAVGGIGGSTSRHGMQTDNVLALDVVTGDGRHLTCSPQRQADLFDAVRGGLAQCAVITRATLRLVRAPERVLRFQLFYPDLRALAADQRRLLEEDRFDQLQGAVLPDGAGGWRYQLEGAVFHDSDAAPDREALLAGLSDDRRAAEFSDLTYIEDAGAFARLESLLRSNGHWFNPHPWWLTFLPGSNAEQIAEEVLKGLTPDDVGPFGRVTCYPMRTAGLRTPLVRLPDESIAFPCNVIRMPASNDTAETRHMVARNRALYERVRDAGGLLYPVSAFPTMQSDWKDHFGPQWPLLREAKLRYDPGGTLTPGYEVFRTSPA
ncbi:FAD-binding protein [Pseudochelatococcus sp. B33]